MRETTWIVKIQKYNKLSEKDRNPDQNITIQTGRQGGMPVSATLGWKDRPPGAWAGEFLCKKGLMA